MVIGINRGLPIKNIRLRALNTLLCIVLTRIEAFTYSVHFAVLSFKRFGCNLILLLLFTDFKWHICIILGEYRFKIHGSFTAKHSIRKGYCTLLKVLGESLFLCLSQLLKDSHHSGHDLLCITHILLLPV